MGVGAYYNSSTQEAKAGRYLISAQLEPHRKIVDFSETIQTVVLRYSSLPLTSLNFCGLQKSRCPTQERKMTARKNVSNAGTGRCLGFQEFGL